MKKLPLFVAVSSFLIVSTTKASAHCPLCTGGAGAAAAAAAYFGVSYGSLGVLLGGFTTALSLWLARKPNKDYFKHQATVIFWAIYASTLLPLYFMFKGDYVSRYISIAGEYGSLLNRTYLLDLFIVGTLLGSLILYYSPRISRWISAVRGGKFIKFQGLIVTFALLILGAVLLQVWPR